MTAGDKSVTIKPLIDVLQKGGLLKDGTSNSETKIIINENGQKVAEIDTIAFSSKRKIDWDGVEKYLKRYVGQKYKINETDDIIDIKKET